MDYSNINQRLRNDIIHAKYPDAYYKNQMNEINQFNNGKCASNWKYFIDGYEMRVNGDTYVGFYRYDKKIDKCKPMNFQSFSHHAGLDFLNFVNAIINGKESTFLLMNGLEVFDLRKSLSKIKECIIHDTEIDNLLIIVLNRYFPKLESLTFQNCIIKKECDFSKIQASIYLNECRIENFRVFNDTTANIEFLRAHIDRISPTHVYSKTISFKGIHERIYKQLFLKCHFQNLENLTIHPEVNVTEFYYGNDFLFLPKSAPCLENVSIQGKLENFDFLTELSHLLRCDIQSIFDSHGLFYPDVISKKEREKLKKRNLERYKIAKILMPYEEEKFLIGKLEIERILNLAHFQHRLSYTDEEKNALFKNPNGLHPLFQQNIDAQEIVKFYECYYDMLRLRNTENEIDAKYGKTYRLGIQNGIPYTYFKTDFEPFKKQIVLTKNFIYHYDNKPILFENCPKPIKNIRDATAYIKDHGYVDDMIEEDDNQYKELLNWLQNQEEEITIDTLSDVVQEFFQCSIKNLDFRKLGEGGRYILGILEKSHRLEDTYHAIYEKYFHCRECIKKLISENYDKFTIAEKTVLLADGQNYDMQDYSIFKIDDDYAIVSEYDENLIQVIDDKTNYLYSKYMGILKMYYMQLQMHQHGNDAIIKREYIKKLNFDKK